MNYTFKNSYLRFTGPRENKCPENLKEHVHV